MPEQETFIFNQTLPQSTQDTMSARLFLPTRMASPVRRAPLTTSARMNIPAGPPIQPPPSPLPRAPPLLHQAQPQLSHGLQLMRLPAQHRALGLEPNQPPVLNQPATLPQTPPSHSPAPELEEQPTNP